MDIRQHRRTRLPRRPGVVALLPLLVGSGVLTLWPGRSAVQPHPSRSVQLLANRPAAADPPPLEADPPPFDVAQSAGLFVGVRHFSKDPELAEVRYAVDDAVDLAFTLALDLDVRFLPPGRVALALSGEPQKPESQQRLEALKGAGAKVYEADQAEILTLLESQTQAAGKGGILVVAFATH